MVTELSEELLQRLAYQPGFHDADVPRGLTRPPLDALLSWVQPGMRTLETGCGGSTVVFAAVGTRHTSVTPSAAEVERVRGFCAEQGISCQAVDFLIQSSDTALVDWKGELDLMLIDGAHRVPFPLLDWHYTAPWIRVGGRLFIDDVAIPGVHMLYDFLRREQEWRLVEIPGDKVAIFEKVGEFNPDPALDWEAQRYNRPWIYDHVPLSRRWRTWRDRLALRTRLRRLIASRRP